MEPLKRKIGYVKPEVQNIPQKVGEKSIIEEAIPAIISATKAEVEIQALIQAEKDRPKKIVSWIKLHPEFKWSAMCKKVGIDKGNFQRILTSKDPVIKLELIPKIEEILKKYGYK
jgi:hypothetical protein